jgi:hypothetical protein
MRVVTTNEAVDYCLKNVTRDLWIDWVENISVAHIVLNPSIRGSAGELTASLISRPSLNLWRGSLYSLPN